MPDTLVAAKTALYDLLAVDAQGRPQPSLEKVRRVYRGEPAPGQAEKPICVTVASTSMGGDGITVTVRVYAATDTQPLQAQDDLDATVDAIETLLEASTTFTQGTWTVVYVDALEALVASCPCRTPGTGF